MFVLLISIVLALIIVIFAVQNATIVPVDFLFWTTDLPLVLVIFCSVFAGALLMFCLALWRELKHKIKKSDLNTKLNKTVNQKFIKKESQNIDDITKNDKNININEKQQKEKNEKTI